MPKVGAHRSASRVFSMPFAICRICFLECVRALVGYGRSSRKRRVCHFPSRLTLVRRSSGRLRDPHLTLSMIRGFAGSPTLLSKYSLPCSFPARSSRETPVQAIEMLLVLARLRLAPPCIFRKSPCIFPNCRERQVGLRLHPQPRSPARHWPSSRSMGARALQSENPRHTRFPVRKEIGRCEQSYTDAEARSARTHQYRALPGHQPPTLRMPEGPGRLVIGWPLSSVA
jgi:hypothetical protein